MNALKNIILCADDFAQNKEISEGILHLANKGRLSAISCMTGMPEWDRLADKLLNLHNIQLGLHFNLTHANEPYIKPLNHWLVLSLIRVINRAEIRDALNQQLDLFENKIGRAPDFVDGHQHVHAFPVIRDILIETLKQRYADKMPFVRNLHFLPGKTQSAFKAIVLKIITCGFTKLLTDNHIPHNTYFAGLYDLNPNTDFKSLIEHWFKTAKPNTLIMCHPGFASGDLTDPIREARVKELQVLEGLHWDL